MRVYMDLKKWAFREVIEDELINYARIDLCIVGGLTEALKITHWCETHYIDIAPHNPLGPVSAAACVALCMASTNVGVQEMPRMPGSFAKDLFPQQIRWSDGYVYAPNVAGLGVDFDEKLAEERRVSSRAGPRYSDATTAHSPTGNHYTYVVPLGVVSLLALDAIPKGGSSRGGIVF